VGKEGPMIHSGAVVGAGLPQVRIGGPGDAFLRMGLLHRPSRCDIPHAISEPVAFWS
jgi:hypothetical protein